MILAVIMNETYAITYTETLKSQDFNGVLTGSLEPPNNQLPKSEAS